ncbi:hypothetical protein EDC01DRAFT_785220 [Geopyxis carbonaria]|nr:hypothetical protein EDC01DRAFT_785220 [Geopyxis carbonaria]
MRVLTNFRRSPRKSDISPEDPNSPPRNVTPFKAPEAPWTPRFRIPSTTPSAVSEGTGRKIQKHLDAGNPIYIGVDPGSLPHTSIPPSCKLGVETTETKLRGGNVDEELGGALKSRSTRRAALEKLLCGLSLDCFAKGTFSTGLFLALYGIQIGLQGFIGFNTPSDGNRDLYSIMLAMQISWGFILGGGCIFGMLLMWGAWRRSPSVALIFTVFWTCTTVLALVVSAIYFYMFFTVRTAIVNDCRAKTVRTTLEFSPSAPRRSAPPEEIAACIDRARGKGLEYLIWGLIYIVMLAFNTLTILWSRDYRKRLLELSQLEILQESLSNPPVSPVALMLGTRPPLMRSRGTLGPTKAESEKNGSGNGTSPVSPLSSGSYPSDASSVSTIVTSSGVIPVMHQPDTSEDERKRRPKSYEVPPLNVVVRHSEMYANPLPELVVETRSPAPAYDQKEVVPSYEEPRPVL